EAVGTGSEGGGQSRPRARRRGARPCQDQRGAWRTCRNGARQASLQDEHVHGGRKERKVRDRRPQRGSRRPDGVLTWTAQMAAASSTGAGSLGAHQRQVIPILEIVLFAVFAAAPIVLQDYMTVFVTRVFILALLALSFDLVWGYS